MIKSFKIRIYPTKEQEELMWKHINQCRFIWNYMLNYQIEAYEADEKYLSAYDMMKLITPLKKENKWLYDCSNASYQIVCRDLDKAYKAFFKKIAKFPKFKSKKKSKPSFPVRSEIWFDDKGFVHIEKLKSVKYKTDFDLPTGKGAKFTNARISYKCGKWQLSFGMECESQAPELNDYSVGIDLGVKSTMVVAYDNDKKLVFDNINKSRKIRMLKKKIKHTQRSISRKYEANKQGNKYIKTNNIERQEEQLRKLHKRISDIRMNYIHQSTHKLVSLLPKRIVMEDLNVLGMMKNRHLSKAIQEQCFFEIIRQMQYKCEWNGIEFVQVDRFYPSSKMCHNCGCIKSDLKLSDRTYVCECGYTEDRDYNAALNLMSYGN